MSTVRDPRMFEQLTPSTKRSLEFNFFQNMARVKAEGESIALPSQSITDVIFGN